MVVPLEMVVVAGGGVVVVVATGEGNGVKAKVIYNDFNDAFDNS